jgi:hypothetical protein
MPSVQAPQVLMAYRRALGRESHVIARRPDLTWQQLHNRLQWDTELADLDRKSVV